MSENQLKDINNKYFGPTIIAGKKLSSEDAAKFLEVIANTKPHSQEFEDRVANCHTFFKSFEVKKAK